MTMAAAKIRSMTGYGRAQGETPLGRFSVEIKSVNSRYKEFAVSMSREIAPLEYQLRHLLKGAIERGKVDCRAKFELAPTAAPRARINEPLVIQYLLQLKAIATRVGQEGQATLSLALTMPGAIDAADEEADLESRWPALAAVAEQALAAFHAEREREGAALVGHLREELALLRRERGTIAASKDQAAVRFRERLAARIAELEEQTRSKLDPNRLEMEVALFADRCDISEELVRLEAHLNRLEELLGGAGAGPSGKALDFLAHEILREVNTLSAKVRDLDLTQSSLEMKASVERIREQIQNIE